MMDGQQYLDVQFLGRGMVAIIGYFSHHDVPRGESQVGADNALIVIHEGT